MTAGLRASSRCSPLQPSTNFRETARNRESDSEALLTQSPQEADIGRESDRQRLEFLGLTAAARRQGDHSALMNHGGWSGESRRQDAHAEGSGDMPRRDCSLSPETHLGAASAPEAGRCRAGEAGDEVAARDTRPLLF